MSPAKLAMLTQIWNEFVAEAQALDTCKQWVELFCIVRNMNRAFKDHFVFVSDFWMGDGTWLNFEA